MECRDASYQASLSEQNRILSKKFLVNNNEQQAVFVKHECPRNGHFFFENCDLDIWP